MHGRTIKMGTGIVAAFAAAIALFPANAQADYAPGSHDVVGVGSDTLQALTNFAADGSYVADPGYNSIGNKNKFISIDATADANTRLAYGPAGGLGTGTGGTTGCGPGTGSGIGTGNSGVTDTTPGHLPCVLAPTVVLRSGLSPEQRPNGSGAGYNLLKADTTSGGASIGNGTFGTVNFSRASAGKNGSNANFDSITVGKDDLAILSAAGTTANPTNAFALTTTQLISIYNCSVTTWAGLAGAPTGASTNTIYAMLPQVGSGTRSVFLADLGTSGTPLTPGSCVHNVEENDPEAIIDSGSAADAIEPMANTRLNLFQGISGTGGAANGGTANGYFADPTCPFNSAISSLTGVAGTGNAPAQCQGTAATLTPQVKEWLGNGGAGGNSSSPYDDNRNLYIYFRHADTFSSTIWQPGGTLNWVRTMFYNPCTASITSTTILTGAAATAAGCSLDSFGNEVGPGGAPFFDGAAGQQDVADAGVQPTYLPNIGNAA